MMPDYRTHIERLRAIREERNVPSNPATRSTQPANQHDEDTAAVDRFLRTINRRPR